MDVSFIVTCYNREAWVPHLIEILSGYRHIKARYVVCYSGTQSMSHDFRVTSPGHHWGDYVLTMGGYYLLRQHGPRYVKLACDSWLLEDTRILDIFCKMEEQRAPYGGNYWSESALSTDIFFADTRWGNLFTTFQMGTSFETSMAETVARLGPEPYIVPEREPVHKTNRHECRALGWTMHHDLQRNLDNKNQWT